ncbi:DNA gyrase subunit A [Candidatus Methylomirabilis sp.]|uniref:DNA gyrase subunit A n=1 Tax=Candidatus Methylomirabilis sp. TaxID=2032687 RepID=UPI002A5C9FB2|nr:DNA gyrase subunit A [Candidatus Methylomirabilis sp.]
MPEEQQPISLNQVGEVRPTDIHEEMRRSYLDYAMSVIIGRALPDVRDGLKPVHRRVLYAMQELGLTWGRPHKKAARVVGEVLGKYHPHGDTAVYDTIVRLVQDFSMRYPLIDGQGNFGSVDGDAPAAMRYTEVRLAKIAQEMLRDIDKETVDLAPNFDDTLEEPTLLPAALPNLLVNGSSGIAVGMATNIPPHNLGETVDALLLLLEDPATTLDRLMAVLPGPDFPTGAYIYGRAGIRDAYLTGRGLVRMRAKAFVEKGRGGRESIIVSALPYQVNKAKLIERIAELVRDRKIEGISDLRDESDREGMRIVIELKKDEMAPPILNQLYKHTAMQSTFGVIMLALVDNQPKVLALKETLQHFIDHRKTIVIRRTRFDLRKAEERAHILEGYRTALDHLDAVIALIRRSRSVDDARAGLMDQFGMSQIQAQAILDLRLQRLTQLERQKIQDEYSETIAAIERYRAILASEALVCQIIKEELAALRETYADPRRTQILEETAEIELEDMLADEEMVIPITHSGYIKRSNLNVYRSQRRGGKGMTGMATKEEDYVEHLFVATTHSYLLLFTNQGKVHWLKVHELPQLGHAAKGKPLINFLQLGAEEKITTMIPIRQFEVDRYLLMVTKRGIIKKTELNAYDNPRAGGIIALTLDEGDELIAVRMTKGDDEILLGTKGGMAIRFKEDEVRPVGRGARGVKGISLEANDEVVGAEVVSQGAAVLTVTERGYGKRTDPEEYRLQSRGGKGIINIRITDRNGPGVGMMLVRPGDQIMMISQEGRITRLRVDEISLIGRATQGVRLQGLTPSDRVAAVTRLVSDEDGEGEPAASEPLPEPGGEADPLDEA